MDSDSETEMESKLIPLITQMLTPEHSIYSYPKVISLITQTISLVSSIDLSSPPRPESELMRLITQTISLFNSMDLDSQPEPLSEIISFISQISLVSSMDSDSKQKPDDLEKEYTSLVEETLSLKPEPELISLIHQIFSLVISMNSKWKKLISLSPQVLASYDTGKLYVNERFRWKSYDKWDCLPVNWDIFRLTGEDATHFYCGGCSGKNHEEHGKALVEIKHYSLHPKHFLQLVWLQPSRTRKCYCCHEDLKGLLCFCSVCDFAINFGCLEKPPVLSIDHPKWHEHTLALFPRKTSLTCSLCALTHSKCPFYICPPCDFVVHQRCISLPRVIRISRHLHRISFTPCFGQGDWFCGVCRRKIDNDNGGYSCNKENCSYAAHSKCATQKNVWDGVELEGEPEEIEEEEEEVKPFVRISEGIIQHFSHEHHYLRLDENTRRKYDENKQCQACITPIYFGNCYSCMQCDFIIHEICANLSRKIYNPIHPHILTLVGGSDGVMKNEINLVGENENPFINRNRCLACPWFCTAGFFYECSKEDCRFKLHVQCATISEPLDHESHMHPLFLTSKPGERRTCRVCKGSRLAYSRETFNCIECDFCLCFACATLPQKVRYKHDKHILTLSYGEKASTITSWCEVCEKKLDLRERFYMCDEYCCVYLHIECLLGEQLYTKPGSSWLYYDREVSFLANNQHMSRPMCLACKKRCLDKIVFQCSGSIFCSMFCVHGSIRNVTK